MGESNMLIRPQGVRGVADSRKLVYVDGGTCPRGRREGGTSSTDRDGIKGGGGVGTVVNCCEL